MLVFYNFEGSSEVFGVILFVCTGVWFFFFRGFRRGDVSYYWGSF